MRTATLVLLLAALPVATQEEPTAADFAAQVARLTPTASREDRLQVVQWVRARDTSKHSLVAVPALEKLVRLDPDAKVREEAVVALAHVARHHKRPCPLALVEAIRDKEDLVRWNAGVYVALFKTDVEPGAVGVLVEGSRDDRAEVREHCVIHLGIAGGRDPKALAAIDRAKADPNSAVRYAAHGARFTASGDLGEYLAYLVRLREDPAGFQDKYPAGSEAAKLEQTRSNLFQLGAAVRLGEWAEGRPDELAAGLLKLLDDKSALMRRGGAGVIGATARRVEQVKPFDPVRPTESGPSPFETLLPSLDPEFRPREPTKQPPPGPSRVAVKLLAQKVEARLRALRDKDPDESVRAAAKAALDRLAELPEVLTIPPREVR